MEVEIYIFFIELAFRYLAENSITTH